MQLLKITLGLIQETIDPRGKILIQVAMYAELTNHYDTLVKTALM